jgi:hypothetical protein
MATADSYYTVKKWIDETPIKIFFLPQLQATPTQREEAMVNQMVAQLALLERQSNLTQAEQQWLDWLMHASSEQ